MPVVPDFFARGGVKAENLFAFVVRARLVAIDGVEFAPHDDGRADAAGFVIRPEDIFKRAALFVPIPMVDEARLAGDAILLGVRAQLGQSIGSPAMAGLDSAGLVSLGLVSAGFVSAGLVSAGFVSAGFVSTGFVSVGFVSAGFVSAGCFTSAGVAGVVFESSGPVDGATGGTGSTLTGAVAGLLAFSGLLGAGD